MRGLRAKRTRGASARRAGACKLRAAPARRSIAHRLFRQPGRLGEARGFASPPRGGFALVGGRGGLPVCVPHVWFVCLILPATPVAPQAARWGGGQRCGWG